MIRNKLKAGILSALFLIAFAVTDIVAQHDTLSLDPAVRYGKLSNGLTYYIRKNSRPENKSELRLVVNAGSILEDEDQLGLAHFTEHMAFNGSKHFQKNEIVSFLQSIGVEFGADLNAYTSFDETVYILPIPTQNMEHVKTAFQILHDWASEISFDEDEINKERGVVLEEERQGKGAEERIFRKTFPEIFQASRYATRLPIGKPEIISTFKRSSIKRFYDEWYRPDLMAVVAVGDFNVDSIEHLIRNQFSNIRHSGNLSARASFAIPLREKTKALVVTDPEATNHAIQIYYSFSPSNPLQTQSDFHKRIIRNMVVNMLNQRFSELTQVAKPPFIFGGSSIGGWVRGYEAFNSIAYPGTEGPAKAIETLVIENERARKFGFIASELERVKRNFLNGIERSYNEREKTESSSLTDEYVAHFLEGEASPGIESEFQLYKELLPAITLTEVNDYAAEMIPPYNSPSLVIFTGPEKANFNIPGESDLLTFLQDAGKKDILPFEDEFTATSLMDVVPKPGRIKTEKKFDDVGVTEIEFANGVTVTLKPTDFKNDQVVLSGSRYGGQYHASPEFREEAEYAATLVGQMGVGDFTPVQIRKILSGRTVSVSTRIGPVSESVSGYSGANDVEKLLQLVHLYFTEPRYDEELFRSFINKQIPLYENMRADPEYVFQDSVLKKIYGDHPWAPRIPSVKTFQNIDGKKALDFYRQRFQSARGFKIVICGSINIDSIKNDLAIYLGSLPSSDGQSTFKDVGLRPKDGPIKAEVKKGTEEKSLIRLLWAGESSFTEEESLKLHALAEIFNIRVTETLREELSGIYGGGASASMTKIPYEHYSFGINFPCGPENVAKLLHAVEGEIARIKTTGPEENILQKVKETWLQHHLVDLRENGYWARKLLYCSENRLHYNWIVTHADRVRSITPSHIKETAVKYLTQDNYFEFILNPQ